MKTAILITARLKSFRLPKKAIKDIHGRPMIVHMLDRLKRARHPDEIIICTSSVAEDDPLISIAKQEKVEYYRGHPEDVLLRITQAAKQFGVDTIISCTADNPFVDPVYIDQLLDFHWKHQYDYSKTEGLPFGTFSYALSYPAMEKACKIKAKVNSEVWGGYFTDTGLFSCGIYEVDDPKVRWPELRLTVDTPEDFTLIDIIFDELYIPGKIFSLEEIVSLCKERPDLVNINANIKQKAASSIEVKKNKKKD